MAADVKLKQLGQNMILTVDEKKYSKKVPEAENREVFKQLFKDYGILKGAGKEKKLKQLIGMFEEKTNKIKQTAKTAKVVEKKIKKEQKKNAPSVNNDLKKQLEAKNQEIKNLQAKIDELTKANPQSQSNYGKSISGEY